MASEDAHGAWMPARLMRLFQLVRRLRLTPHLCQGGGTCASTCPSGAISYVYPKASEQIDILRRMIREYRLQAGNQGANLLIYDNEHGAHDIAGAVSAIPESVLPFAVEEIGSVGLDILGCALAYGASQIYLYVPDTVTSQVKQTLEFNQSIIAHSMKELKIETHGISMLNNPDQLEAINPPDTVINDVATFAAIGNKRVIIRAALNYFFHISPVAE